jgi:hypothetical protein
LSVLRDIALRVVEVSPPYLLKMSDISQNIGSMPLLLDLKILLQVFFSQLNQRVPIHLLLQKGALIHIHPASGKKPADIL